MLKKLKLFFWYLKRPGMHRVLIRRLTISGKVDSNHVSKVKLEAVESLKWCRKKEKSKSEVIKDLGLMSKKSIGSELGNIFSERLKMINDTHEKMGGGGDYVFLYQVAEKLSAKTCIETGVAYVYSSLAILMSLEKRDGVLYSTDRPYPLKNMDKYVGVVVPERLKKHWRLFRTTDRDGLPKILKKTDSIDFCHYDSDKSRKGRLWAYPLLWEKIRKGGFFISDDIADNLLFKEFNESLNLEPIVFNQGVNYVGV